MGWGLLNKFIWLIISSVSFLVVVFCFQNCHYTVAIEEKCRPGDIMKSTKQQYII